MIFVSVDKISSILFQYIYVYSSMTDIMILVMRRTLSFKFVRLFIDCIEFSVK